MRVLVATDLSEAANHALCEGAALASSPQDAIAAVYVLPPLPFTKMWLPRPDDEIARITARASEAVQERVHDVIGDQAEVFIEDENDYSAIIRRAESWRADVIAVGSHGASGLAGSFGSVADRVLCNAHCSVLVVRPRIAHGWVLAATDLSDPSLHAVVVAAAEARRRGAQLEVVRAVGFLDAEATYLIGLGTPSATSPPGVYETLTRGLAECVADLGVQAKCKVLDHKTASAIVGECEAIGAELVLVAAQGKTALGRMSLGGVANKVARAAPCSVLVVRP
jgi:nucleotide-binding universal stress UspA family protein